MAVIRTWDPIMGVAAMGRSYADVDEPGIGHFVLSLPTEGRQGYVPESGIKKGGLGHPGSCIEEGNHEHYQPN